MAPLDYFRRVLAGEERAEELARAKQPIVGTVCNFVPEEIVRAAGAIPVRVDSGSYEALAQADQALACDACPIVRATVGDVLRGAGLLRRLDLLVIAGSCDAKRKMAELLADACPVHIMALPASKSEPLAREAWLDEVLALRDRVEELCGKRIGRAELRWAVELSNRRVRAFRRLHRLRAHHPPPLTGEQLFLIANASFADDAARWITQVELLCAELGEELGKRAPGRAPGADGPRLLLTGAPLIFPNFKLISLLERSGAVVVADDMCSATERLYHPVVASEWSELALLRAIADKALLPSTCPCFVGSADRVNRVRELAREFSVDGAVYHALRMCVAFDMEAKPVAEGLAEEGIPTLRLQSDYTAEDEELLRTRIEAFLEMLAEKAPQGGVYAKAQGGGT